MKPGWDKVIGLNVHVDTFEGMRRGVPRLLDLFRACGIRTTFFSPMGKDHTGWTVKRVFTRRGFVSKTRRAGVIETFGVKTLMRGLLLPGIEIATRNAPILQRVREQGHELGIHGLDHVYWHDHIKRMDEARTEATLSEAFRTFKSITGEKPLSFAAPGWMINAHALAFFEKQGLAYSSDTRGTGPFYPRMGGTVFRVMQLPLTLPTLDEMIGLEGHDPHVLARYFAGLLTPGLNLMAVHTELEGKRWTPFLASFIELATARGYRFERLIDIASRLGAEGDLPVCECEYGTIRGRAGEVTLQGKRADREE
jgi:undecaprenyl phosphate-alpha-L-ara4FN deformylase